MFSINEISLQNPINEYTTKDMTKRNAQLSLSLFLNSEIYNSIINTVVNYQSHFRFSPDPKLMFICGDDELSLYEFFKEFRKMLIVFGIVILQKIDSKTYQVISPLLINFNNTFQRDEDGNIIGIRLKNKYVSGDFVIFTNTPIAGVDMFLPEYYFCLEEINKLEQLKKAILVKRNIIANIAVYLKMQNPQEGKMFGISNKQRC